MHLQDISAIVTGGASGLGEATARLLAAHGARVAIFDKNISAAIVIASEINGLGLEVDVTDESQVLAAFDKVKAHHGIARILVHCAGIASAGRLVGKKGPLPLYEFEKTIRINLIGTFNMMRMAAAEMMTLDISANQERGVIITTASIAAFEGQIGQVAYAAAKGGVVSMILPAARELAPFGIRVNAIAPGLFMTPLLEALPQDAIQALSAGIPFPPRLGLAQEYALLAKHIIENTYLNGETIRLDGALRMQAK